MGSGLIISAMPASAGVNAEGGNTVTCYYASGASFMQQPGQDCSYSKTWSIDSPGADWTRTSAQGRPSTVVDTTGTPAVTYKAGTPAVEHRAAIPAVEYQAAIPAVVYHPAVPAVEYHAAIPAVLP